MKVVFSGGGTGGHIYPALATISEWKKQDPDLDVLYIGGERGLEKDIVPAAGIKFEHVAVQGFVRSASIENFKTVYLFLTAVKKAKTFLKKFQPDVVVGTGGYVSGPVLYAAQTMGIPTVIHEQNSVVGVTNKFLARKVTKVGVAFPAAMKDFKEATVVGNPRAQQVVAGEQDNHFDFATLGLKNDMPTVMIFGGSQGAPKLNQAVISALHQFNNQPYQILFATGQKRYEDVQTKLRENGIIPAGNVAIVPYIANMQELMPRVDLVIGRAGATSMAEQTALGKPMVLIPSPYVTNDHQTKNAKSMVDAGAAEMITEDSLSGTTLFGTVDNLMKNDDARNNMSKNSAKLGVRDAADEFIELIKQSM